MAKISKSGKSAAKSGERCENSDVRKLRNRISQKAFRARQAMRIKELEERLHQEADPDDQWMTHLQNQNTALREQLLETHKKFLSLQVSMKALSDTTALALGVDGIDETEPPRYCERCKQEIQKTTLQSENKSSEPQRNRSASTETTLVPEPISQSQQTQQAPTEPTTISNDEMSLTATSSGSSEDTESLNLNYFPITELDNHVLTISEKENEFNIPFPMDLFLSQDLGPSQYKGIMETSPFIAGRSYGLRRTNSTFSDHIDALEYCIFGNWSRSNMSMIHNEKIFSSIQSMLLTFVSMSWQSMTAWHTYTRAHLPLIELMAWRMYKVPETYFKIVPSYRPTKLQMAVSHPSIIDWIPWPSLRDKLILHHSANPCLDSLICDIGNSYVVPADLSLLVKCPQSVLGYVGVWDLIRAIAPEATQVLDRSLPAVIPEVINNMDADMMETLTLPAQNANALFSSKVLAAQAFKAMGMDRGAFNFRLDPAFFQRHPELYDNKSNLMAQGMALRPDLIAQMPVPRELDSSVLGQYQEMSKYVVDMALNVPDILQVF